MFGTNFVLVSRGLLSGGLIFEGGLCSEICSISNSSKSFKKSNSGYLINNGLIRIGRRGG